MSEPLFTVFTPTYNRAHTLLRVYDSLVSQTLKSFEWLIVDDGSVDDTEDLVGGFISEGKICIRYFRQENGGKHVAFNYGVREARGELFLSLDSDDSCVPHALERFSAQWSQIPDRQRLDFSGVTCLCINEDGEFVGGELPSPFLDGRPFEIIDRYKLKGEKWGFHRTEILRNYPFPEFSGERFVPESLVWNRIGVKYRIRFINEALRLYFDTPNGLSGSVIKIRQDSPRSTFLCYSEMLMLPLGFPNRCRAAANLWRFSIQSSQWQQIFSRKFYVVPIAVGLLPGLLLACLDRLRMRNC